MKQIFGPTLKMFIFKAIMALPIFFIIEFFVTASQMNVADYHYSGYPFKYWEGGGMCPYGPCTPDHNYFNLTLDILIWFLISCLIVTLISLLWRKKKSPSATGTV